MVVEYTGLDGKVYQEKLTPVEVSGVLLHATPDSNIEKIRKEGLKTGMPRIKLMVDLNALFCTKPSNPPNTSDLFRYYNDWSIIVIDAGKIPNQKWYIDFLAQEDSSNNGQNLHILTFEDIPPYAIRKVLK